MMYPEDRIEEEIRRLTSEMIFALSSQSLLVEYKVQCNGTCEDVISKVKEVLIAVDRNSLGETWPKREDWAQLLPPWFVRASMPERSPVQSQIHLVWWTRLPEEEKDKYAQIDRPWSLGNWVYWFRPERRSWYWGNAYQIDKEYFFIRVEIDGYPFASGALKWLLEASGATSIEG